VLRGLKQRIPAKLKGELDYWFRREPRDLFGGPFNGQLGRVCLFEALIRIIDPVLILETGTFRGTTTQWLAATGRPVITMEGDPRGYGFARLRLRRLKGVRIILGDSRASLRKLAVECEPMKSNRPVLAYLDAHWNSDLPLEEEIEIIFSANPRAVAVVDDFEVSDDPGYLFDDYGPGATLNLDYLAKAVRDHQLSVFYPTLPSVKETGFRRGCVVLGKTEAWGRELSACQLLRGAPLSR
jgi:hypothetical protein